VNNKIYLVTGHFNSEDHSYDWNHCAFVDEEAAKYRRDQLAAEWCKFVQNPPEDVQRWEHPMDPRVTVWSGVSPLPEIDYTIELVPLI
jgi:hypothetical protein